MQVRVRLSQKIIIKSVNICCFSKNICKSVMGINKSPGQSTVFSLAAIGLGFTAPDQ